jgi:hypothetical protein
MRNQFKTIYQRVEYVKNLNSFIERKRTKRELELIPEFVLQSKLGTKAIRNALVDIKLYKEIKEKLGEFLEQIYKKIEKNWKRNSWG